MFLFFTMFINDIFKQQNLYEKLRPIHFSGIGLKSIFYVGPETRPNINKKRTYQFVDLIITLYYRLKIKESERINEYLFFFSKENKLET